MTSPTRFRPRGVSFAAALTAVLALAVLALPSVAGAAPVQEFNVQLKDIRTDGRYTIVFTANSYDTTGEQPPIIKANTLRVAAGVKIRKDFLTKAYQCKADDVREALLASDGSRNYTSRLKNLSATYKRTRKRMPKKTAAGLKTCVRAQIGQGNVVADVRPTFKRPVPANFFVYLAKPTVKGADAAFSVLVVLDEKSWLWAESPFLRTFRLAFTVNMFYEPTSDGLYGYRVVLPDGGTGGVRASVAELRVTTPGVTKTKRTVKCLRKKKGKCTKRKVSKKKIFWLTQPKCPKSGLLDFKSDYVYETGLKETKAIQLPCPRFIK